MNRAFMTAVFTFVVASGSAIAQTPPSVPLPAEIERVPRDYSCSSCVATPAPPTPPRE